jgi:hypothetical protein
LPLPLAPPVIVIHVSASVADQAHPAGADTATEPGPPALLKLWRAGEMLNVHVGGSVVAARRLTDPPSPTT